ncbi:MAG: DUF2480 family protein [Bacteroidia bacterium]|nr:DUF2480 family protein [Bacteroidia bacterium]
MADEIINKVEQSGLKTLELDSFLQGHQWVLFDVKNELYEELVLKEKDFRAFVKEHNWKQYEGKVLGIYCSNDAIIPMWAYMLISSAAAPYANQIIYGNDEQVKIELINQSVNQMNTDEYKDERVIVKGCSSVNLPEQSYINITQKLQPHVKSLMFGEACSTVPIYKKRP